MTWFWLFIVGLLFTPYLGVIAAGRLNKALTNYVDRREGAHRG